MTKSASSRNEYFSTNGVFRPQSPYFVRYENKPKAFRAEFSCAIAPFHPWYFAAQISNGCTISVLAVCRRTMLRQ
jgi:hypothetical protein